MEKDEIIIALLDQHFKTIYRSPSAEMITGWSDEEREQQSPMGLVHADDLENAKKIFADTLANPGKPIPASIRALHKNGDFIFLEGTITNLLGNENVKAIIVNLRDVTQRTQAEEVHKKFKGLVENGYAILTILDENFECLYQSPSTTKILGWTNEDHLNVNVLNTIHPNDVSKFMLPFQESLSNPGKPIFASYRMLHKDGHHVTVQGTLTNMLHNESIEGVVANLMDVTERKKSEDDLKFNEQQLEQIYNTTADPIFLLDVEPGNRFKFISVNQAFLKATGLTRDQVVNQYVNDTIPQPSLDMVLEKYNQSIQNKDTVQWEEVSVYPAGVKTASVSVAPVFDEYGNCIQLVGAVHDFTERKMAEDQLRKEKIFSETIINTLPGIFYLFDADGKVLLWNKNFETVSGFSAEEISMMNAQDFMPAEDIETTNQNIDKVFAKDINIFEASLLSKKKEKVPLLTSNTTINIDGKVCVLGTALDLTKQKEAEAGIQQTTEQLRLLTAHLQEIREVERKRIGREIHDELGQQLTAVKMDVAWIDKQTSADHVIKPKLKNIISLLDGSNLSIRKILNELRPAVLDHYGLKDALEWQGRQFSENTGIPLTFHCSDADLKMGEAIATCIFRVFQESLTNITRYAKATQVTSSLVQQNGTLILTVEDDGEGFDPTLAEKRQSFGILGMKERVTSLNGTFQLVASPGKGTTIKASLPDEHNHSNSRIGV